MPAVVELGLGELAAPSWPECFEYEEGFAKFQGDPITTAPKAFSLVKVDKSQALHDSLCVDKNGQPTCILAASIAIDG